MMDFIRKTTTLALLLFTIVLTFLFTPLLTLLFGAPMQPFAVVRAEPATSGAAVTKPNLGVVEIQIEIEDRYEHSLGDKWQSRTLRDGTIEWSIRHDVDTENADTLVLIRLDDGRRSHAAAVIPLHTADGPTRLDIVTDARADVPPMWLERVGERVFMAQPALMATDTFPTDGHHVLSPGDTAPYGSWPGVAVTFHPLIHKHDVLLFRVFVDVGQ